MDFQEKVQTCWENYKKWKKRALAAEDKEKLARFMQKSFFWLEMLAAFTFLWAVEQTQGKNPEAKKKLIIAKAKLTKRLADYADKIWKEMQVG
jgi:hypothetical protein